MRPLHFRFIDSMARRHIYGRLLAVLCSALLLTACATTPRSDIGSADGEADLAAQLEENDSSIAFPELWNLFNLPAPNRRARTQVASNNYNPETGEHTPSPPGQAQIFGSYAAGCIRNPSFLPISGEGFEVMRLSRERYYGHPTLIQFISSFSKYVHDSGMGNLLIGDLAQERGGLMSSGHASHQTGLDADIWFLRLDDDERPQLTPALRERLSARSMVLSNGKGLTGLWDFSDAWVVKNAALRPEVERIFVHPRIKEELCRVMPGQSWLSKVRPWWGHDHHFHVRLACPADSPECRPQEPVPNDDGCGAELAWWFSPESHQAKGGAVVATKPERPTTPWQCRTTEFARVPAQERTSE